jgi:hypothetical protein
MMRSSEQNIEASAGATKSSANASSVDHRRYFRNAIPTGAMPRPRRPRSTNDIVSERRRWSVMVTNAWPMVSAAAKNAAMPASCSGCS